MRKLLLATATMLFTAVAANAAVLPAFEYTGSTFAHDSNPFTVGFKFSLSAATTVDALGYFNDGLAFNHAVGLWNTGGTLIAQTTVMPGDIAIGHFLYSSIAPLTLGPGTYTIGGQVYEGGNVSQDPMYLTGITTIPGYTWLADEQRAGFGLLMPTETVGAYGTNAIAAVNFLVEENVPEPASLALVGAGLFGVGRLRRRRA